MTPEGDTVWEYVIPFDAMDVDAWWGRFGWGDMEMDDMDTDGMSMEDVDLDDWDDADGFMVAQAAFRATRLAPDHPGLAKLEP